MMLASDLTKQMLKPKEKEMAKLFNICERIKWIILEPSNLLKEAARGEK